MKEAEGGEKQCNLAFKEQAPVLATDEESNNKVRNSYRLCLFEQIIDKNLLH
jgi:hypothetical protein